MARVIRLWLIAALAARAEAQEPPRYSLDSVMTSVEHAAQVARLWQDAPDVQRRLDSLLAFLRHEPGARDLDTEQLASIVTRTKPAFPAVARWNRDAARAATQPALRDALLRLARIGTSSIEPRLEGKVSDAEIRALLAPLSAVHAAVLRASQAWNERKLQRFELKYGPGAPTLNGLEVLLNYGAQWLPLFGPGADGTPSRFEIVAGYRALDVASSTGLDSVEVAASGRFGVRGYFWNPDWGTGNRLRRLLTPRHWSAGLVLLGPTEKPFDRAWGPDHRRGVFLGWGELQAAYVFEAPRRLLVGAGARLVPYVF